MLAGVVTAALHSVIFISGASAGSIKDTARLYSSFVTQTAPWPGPVTLSQPQFVHLFPLKVPPLKMHCSSSVAAFIETPKNNPTKRIAKKTLFFCFFILFFIFNTKQSLLFFSK
ncbi:MAG: hypothetical protein US57_C0016G0021 [Candidatus Moranbacteria bacterium GW2011_GWC2_37_73]|nr:MAG: hypothetical protein US57_C0016G0021 [Candidatus Moranbacteria bacterium GW2011_GWC2_37_73]